MGRDSNADLIVTGPSALVTEHSSRVVGGGGRHTHTPGPPLPGMEVQTRGTTWRLTWASGTERLSQQVPAVGGGSRGATSAPSAPALSAFTEAAARDGASPGPHWGRASPLLQGLALCSLLGSPRGSWGRARVGWALDGDKTGEWQVWAPQGRLPPLRRDYPECLRYVVPVPRRVVLGPGSPAHGNWGDQFRPKDLPRVSLRSREPWGGPGSADKPH